MVALEAMERARPVIAASIGGLEDLVRDGRPGCSSPPGEAEPLARAMLALANDPARAAAMGAARRARARAVPRGPLHRADGGGLPLLAHGRRERQPRASAGAAREQREHEVPRHAVARRPGEHPRRERLVDDERRARARGTRPARGRGRRPRAGRAGSRTAARPELREARRPLAADAGVVPTPTGSRARASTAPSASASRPDGAPRTGARDAVARLLRALVDADLPAVEVVVAAPPAA